nr:MAG TPA: hypothetical protein [Caudoviricetes sp.]
MKYSLRISYLEKKTCNFILTHKITFSFIQLFFL